VLIPLRSSSTDAAENLAIEEHLLDRVAESGDSLFLLYVDAPCVVIGRSQNPWVEAATLPALPVFRRLSGGGAVYHDGGNLNWALITPRPSHDQDKELSLVAAAISALGTEALPGPRGGIFAGPGSRLPGAKLSGTARRLSARAVLHHGTLLVESDLAKLRFALGGIVVSKSRALASVPAHVANLADLVPGLGLEAAASGLARSLCGAEPTPVERLVTAGSQAEAVARHRSWEWVYGETPPFAFEPPDFPGCVIDVRKGMVEAVRGQSAGELTRLVGERFDPGLDHIIPDRIEGAQ
jgi:lipoate-protein ligase A